MKSILRHKAVAVIFLVSTIISVHANARDDFVFWPDADYDPAIPAFEDVLGYKPGERITWHGDAVRYFETHARPCTLIKRRLICEHYEQ
jgi:hypothetical protein